MSKNLGIAVSRKLRKELVSDKGKQGALYTKLNSDSVSFPGTAAGRLCLAVCSL